MTQTLKQKIVARMSALDVTPKKSLGQNFLVSDNVVERIVAAAEPQRFASVVEIGPGLGALTDLLKDQSKDFVVFELDREFANFWRNQGLQVHEVDALRYHWQQFPWNQGEALLVSNLPYQISSRLVVEFSILPEGFTRMVLMFQKEVAQRIVAKPSTAQYGLLSVIAQIFWDIDMILEAGTVDFMPKPKVASRVLRFQHREAAVTIRCKEFLTFVKLAFANRRKKLLPKLVSFKSKEDLKKIFTQLGFSEDLRAENLKPQQFIDLYLSIKRG